jgi:hypothetical protein
MSITLQNRAQANATVNGVSSATYVADADGVITSVNQPGWRYQTSSDNDTATGLAPTPLRFSEFKNTDGSALAAAAAAGKFGQSITLGTSQYLVSEAANNNTKTDDAICEYVLPANYVAGANLTVTVNASITGSGTLSTKTANVKAYLNANNGTQGSNLGSGAAAITAAGADIAFTITGTTLTPGAKLTFELETVLTETASSNMVANINSVRVS